jgi:hypothetical protein
VACIQYDTDSEDTDDEIKRIQQSQVKRSVTPEKQEPMTEGYNISVLYPVILPDPFLHHPHNV